MILLLDTSTPMCRALFVNGEKRIKSEWLAERRLAKALLGWLIEQLTQQGKVPGDLTGIGVFAGPGSFTGLRIGLTVMNTFADGLGIPIVSVRGDDWQDIAIDRLKRGEDDRIALPYYGSEAHITMPRK